MKRNIAFCAVALVSMPAFSQNNYYPTTGNVGLGTTTSTANFNLHVHGTTNYLENDKFGNSVNYGVTSRIGLTNTTTGFTATDGLTMRMSQNDFSLRNRENGDLTFQTGNVYFNFSGSLGRGLMGTGNITGTDFGLMNYYSSDNGIYIRTTLAGKYGLSIRSGALTDNAMQVMSVDGTTRSFGVLANGAVAINSSQLATAATPVIAVNNGSANTFTVLKSGEIQCLLNSTTPTDKLFTFSNGTDKLLQLTNDGILRARGMKVNVATWADYVFEKDYKLRSLDEVKAYISTNGHLPEVPSTAEVTENGVDVAEMNEILLKKVEELTLYLLQQDAKIKSLESSIEKLTNK